MKSIDELRNFWQQNIKKRLAKTKKEYKKKFPSPTKYWVAALLPIPLLLAVNILLLFVFHRKIADETLFAVAGACWAAGIAVISFGTWKIFKWSRERTAFMVAVKKDVFAECIDFLDTGLQYDFEAGISEARLRESLLFDRYRFLSEEDRFDGQMNNADFAFCEVALAYQHYNYRSRKRKRRREVKNFLVFDIDLPSVSPGRFVIYPGSRAVQERKTAWKNQAKFSLVMGFLNIVIASLAGKFGKTGGPSDPFVLHQWKYRALYHLYPPRDMQSIGMDSPTKHYTVMYEKESDLPLIEARYLPTLDKLAQLTADEMFVAQTGTRVLIALSGYLGNMTSQMLDFNESGSNISSFKPFEKMYNDLQTNLRIVETFIAGAAAQKAHG